MANHVLSLEVPTVMNTCILSINDTSVYSDIVPITCETLNVTVPGFGYSNQIDVKSGFNLILTACDLQLQSTQCGEVYAELPDGIYIIKYSVSPNDLVYVEYNHLRITKALTRYNKAMCDLDLAACDPPAKVKEKLDKLMMIRMYLDAAKAKVEFCHEPQKGMTLYNYAIKLLNKLECINC
jgi:hypothetical protein